MLPFFLAKILGWDEAFAAMAEQQDDILLDDVDTTDWDRVER